eukprot:GHVL01013123.1.p1 GENE.GHVL01013123.1~~GHVL01013123.1.p1  ORF type:complete len:455 (+),score=47.05 GHVL01013123.1:78-1367(+)
MKYGIRFLSNSPCLGINNLKNVPNCSFHKKQNFWRCESRLSSGTTRTPLTLLSSDQTMLRDTVYSFADEVIRPQSSKMDEKGELDKSILQALFAQGLMGVEIPEEYNGTGGSFTDSLIVIEEIARVDPGVAVIVDIHNTLINRIVNIYGNEDQKQKWLPRLAEDTVGAFCLSESGSGSDAFALDARAVPVENGWKLSGAKQWISNSVEAGLFIVFATVDPSKRHKGITAFLVEAGTKGLTIGQKVDKLGIRASSCYEVVLDDVIVPNENVIGEVGKGYKIAIESLNEGRVGIAAQMLGLARASWEIGVAFLHERKQFGQLIGDFQGVKFQYAQARTEIEAVKLMVYNAAALKEAGEDFAMEAAMAKLKAAQVAESVASQAVEWLGGNGFSKEFPVEKLFRDSKIGSIYEGTSNIQLETIAKLVQKQFKN